MSVYHSYPLPTNLASPCLCALQETAVFCSSTTYLDRIDLLKPSHVAKVTQSYIIHMHIHVHRYKHTHPTLAHTHYIHSHHCHHTSNPRMSPRYSRTYTLLHTHNIHNPPSLPYLPPPPSPSLPLPLPPSPSLPPSLPLSPSLQAKRRGYLEQRGVLRTNCIDCLDRTNVAQFTTGMRFLGVSLRAVGLGDAQASEP